MIEINMAMKVLLTVFATSGCAVLLFTLISMIWD